MPSKELYREIRLLAIQVAKLNDEMRLEACLNPQYREIIGFIKAYSAIIGGTTFDSFIVPLEHIGRATWMRTELTDLGLMLGDKSRTEHDESGLRDYLDGKTNEDE